VLQNQCALGKLKCGVEKAKHTLSSQMSTKLEIESFGNGKGFSETPYMCQVVANVLCIAAYKDRACELLEVIHDLIT